MDNMLELALAAISGGGLWGIIQSIIGRFRNKQQKDLDTTAVIKDIGDAYNQTLRTVKDYCEQVISSQDETIAEFRLDKTEMGEAIGAAADCKIRRDNPSYACPVETANRRRLRNKAHRELQCSKCVENIGDNQND